MKKVAVTQRVDTHPVYGERRDALDQRWLPLLRECGYYPLLIPNHPQHVGDLLEKEGVEGLILTGGNSLVRYGGDAPERDESERILLERAVEMKIPVMGVCRGMQLIQDYFGVALKPVIGHVATRHQLEVAPEGRYAELLSELVSVNAYHELGAFSTVDELKVSARSTDRVIMAVEHRSAPVFGQMWHSERDEPFVVEQLAMFKAVLS